MFCASVCRIVFSFLKKKSHGHDRQFACLWAGGAINAHLQDVCFLSEYLQKSEVPVGDQTKTVTGWQSAGGNKAGGQGSTNESGRLAGGKKSSTKGNRHREPRCLFSSLMTGEDSNTLRLLAEDNNL